MMTNEHRVRRSIVAIVGFFLGVLVLFLSLGLFVVAIEIFSWAVERNGMALPKATHFFVKCFTNSSVISAICLFYILLSLGAAVLLIMKFKKGLESEGTYLTLISILLIEVTLVLLAVLILAVALGLPYMPLFKT